MTKSNVPTLTFRASLGSYLAFCGIWIVLALGYGLLALLRPDNDMRSGILIATIVAIGCVVWMAGHRVRVVSGVLHYRDGLFRSRSVCIADIASLANVWEHRIVLGREIAIPRLIFVGRNGALLFKINPKPFSRKALGALQALLLAADETDANLVDKR
jgi:hypothetical protein